MKRIFWFLLGAALASALVILYRRLPQGQKRYLAYLAKQAPYIPARYFV